MSNKLRGLLLLLLASRCCSAHLTTAVVTVIATSPTSVISRSPTSTPCSELDPVTNRMQWAQQCAMAPSNIVPTPNAPAASTTRSGARGSTLLTSVKSSKSSPRSGESSRSTSSKSSPKSSPTRTDSKARTIPKSTPRSTHTRTSRKPPASTTTHPRSSSSIAPSTNQHSSSPSIGSIAGLVIGILIALLLGWYLWHTKDRWSPYLPCSFCRDEYSDCDEPYWRDGGRFQSQYSYQDPVSRRKFSFESGEIEDDSPTAPYDVRNIGAGVRGVTDYGYGRRYAVMNPDPPSASTVTARSRGEALPAYAQPEDERDVENDVDEAEDEGEDEDSESETSDSERSESRRDSGRSSTDNVSDSSSSYSTDDVNEKEHDAASPNTVSAIIESYQHRPGRRFANPDTLHLTPSSAAFSDAETSDGGFETPSPIAHPTAVYIPYTPGIESIPYRPVAEFRPARADWKRAAPVRSALGRHALSSDE